MKSSFARYPSLADRVDIDQEAGNALASTLAGQGPHDPWFVACDLCDIVALQSAIGSVRSHFGPIGVLVHNAANDRRHDMDGVSVESWDAGVAVNLRHQFSPHKRFHPTCARFAAARSSTSDRSAG
jgi:NAD(P)-dependent dehydrogenase (short-subunit alcohol dehydrogenase family)